MKMLIQTTGCLLAACRVFAGGLELNKDAVTVYPPDAEGAVVVAGPPGCVAGFPPIYVSARNRTTGAPVNAQVSSDGSFSLRVPARPGDAVKLTFFSRGGKDKDMTVRVPGEGPARGGERTAVHVDLGAFSQFGAPEVVQVQPDGRGGTRVHVGRRPTQPVPLTAATASPSAPEGNPSPPATSPAPVDSPTAVEEPSVP